jgi:hypothetical protein
MPDSSEYESRLSVDCPFLILLPPSPPPPPPPALTPVLEDIRGEGRFSGDDSSAAEKALSGGEVSLVMLMLPDWEPTAKRIRGLKKAAYRLKSQVGVDVSL